MATVVPCAKKSRSPRKPRTSLPKCSAAFLMTLYKPMEGSRGVESSLKLWIVPLLVDHHAVGECPSGVDSHPQFHVPPSLFREPRWS